MPIHPMGKLKAKGTLGSPYAVRDFDAINPDYGTPDDLKRLVDAAHRRGMKVFIDIVAQPHGVGFGAHRKAPGLVHA